MKKSSMTQRGFSLLEMMLVIAVLAAVSIAGISYLRDRALNVKIDKTALQMQQWLQAAQAYYIDPHTEYPTGNVWPGSAQDLISNAYMPNYPNVTHSVWYTSKDVGEYKIQGDPDIHGKRVLLTLKLPSNIPYAVAERLANKLPTAKVDKAINTVYAYGAIPGSGGGSAAPGAWDIVFIKTEYLTKADNYYDKNSLFPPNICPRGKQPDLFIIDNGFYNARYWWGTSFYARDITERAIQIFPKIINNVLQGWDVHVQTASRISRYCEFDPKKLNQACGTKDGMDTDTSTILLLGVCKPNPKQVASAW